MPNIQINIKNKVARADRAIIVCDNSDYIAHFDFDAEWDAYDKKTARFVYCGTYTDVVFTGNSCPIPKMQDARSLTIGVYAGDLHTTTPAYVSCVPSILCGNGIPADPTPDVYNQLMEMLNKESGVWYPTVDDAGNMSWTRSMSETEPQPVNIKGADGKDYVLTDADKQEIAKTAAGLVDVPSVQPDWNQNDSTQPDYVKNRPFYTGNPVETVLVEEGPVTFVEDSSLGLYIVEFSSTFEATVGETYKVSWDGSDYECTCVDFNGYSAIGNLSVAGAGSDTGEPFLIGVNNGVEIQIMTADTSASHTFSISRLATEVVKIDKKYLVQPDWNQNDSTQPDYVKNRPFYMGTVETVLVEESTVEFVENNGLYGTRFPSTFEATVGETYKVYWDGTTYECACVDFNDIPAIGNLSIPGAGSDTGEPFVMQVKNGASITIVAADTAASHTFSISGFAPEVVKIDPKYLPDTIATKSEVEAAQTTASNAQTTASNAQTTANNAKSEALDLAARMFGHTSVVDNAFYYDKTLSITSLPACIESIGDSAFYGCSKLALTSLPSGITSIGSNAFTSCSKLALTSLPSGITSIGDSAFLGCSKLALTSLPSGITIINTNVFRECYNLALASLPSGITRIGDSAFQDCTKLALTSLPSGITSIGSNAFYGCTNLTSITFTGTPTSIGSNAFSGCTNLTTINVPWAEGEVANAPWGATNATINYNYTGA